MPKTKILYIDDEDINLRIFKINLGTRFDILTCNSGSCGLKLLEQHTDIPVVVTDMRMPNMNGSDFIRSAKLLHPSIAFFILSGHDITDEINHLIELGMVKKYFRKPFNLKGIGNDIEATISES